MLALNRGTRGPLFHLSVAFLLATAAFPSGPVFVLPVGGFIEFFHFCILLHFFFPLVLTCKPMSKFSIATLGHNGF